MIMRPGVTLAATAVAAAAFLHSTAALDVEIESYECDSSYAVTADIYMDDGSGSARATFGEEVTIYGSLHYNGVYNTGVNGENAYLSAELSLFSIDFSLVNKQAVPLCYFEEEGDENQEGYYDAEGNYYDNAQENGGERFLDQAQQEQECPADGSYPFSIQYVLPSAGTEQASWMATGWTGTGLLQMYAQRNDQMKIGECRLTLSTYVTKKDESSLLGAPSAAATAGIIIALIFAAMLMCCYCYCCIKTRKTKKEELMAGDDITSSFRRMGTTDQDDHSKPPTISLDARSQATGKRSAKEMV